MPKGIRLMRKKSTGYEMINKLVYYENINSVRTVELFSGDISHITEWQVSRARSDTFFPDMPWCFL